MANQRLVNTNFWKDTYVIDLDPVQKLLFLYFLTNPNTTLAGVYEISIRQVAFDTGIDKDMVEKILKKFTDDGKMMYQNSWLVLHNFVKHQRLNPSIVRGIEKAVAELPIWLQETVHKSIFLELLQGSEGTDSTQTGNRLPTASPQYNLTKPNITKPKQKPAAGFDKSKTMNKKVYASAVKADEALEQKEQRAYERKPNDIEPVSDVADKVRAKLKAKGVLKR